MDILGIGTLTGWLKDVAASFGGGGFAVSGGDGGSGLDVGLLGLAADSGALGDTASDVSFAAVDEAVDALRPEHTQETLPEVEVLRVVQNDAAGDVTDESDATATGTTVGVDSTMTAGMTTSSDAGEDEGAYETAESIEAEFAAASGEALGVEEVMATEAGTAATIESGVGAESDEGDGAIVLLSGVPGGEQMAQLAPAAGEGEQEVAMLGGRVVPAPTEEGGDARNIAENLKTQQQAAMAAAVQLSGLDFDLSKFIPKQAQNEDMTVRVVLTQAEAGVLAAHQHAGVTFEGDAASGIVTMRGAAAAIREVVGELMYAPNEGDNGKVGMQMVIRDGDLHLVRKFVLDHDIHTRQVDVLADVLPSSGVAYYAQSQNPFAFDDAVNVGRALLSDTRLARSGDAERGQDITAKKRIEGDAPASSTGTDDLLEGSATQAAPAAPVVQPSAPVTPVQEVIIVPPVVEPEPKLVIIPGPGAAVIASNLNFSGFNDAQGFTEDTAGALTGFTFIANGVGNSVTVTLSLSDTAAGALSTATSSGASGSPAVTSTWNAGTGQWQASGDMEEVEELLAGITFTPTADYDTDFTISVSAVAGGTSSSNTISMTATAIDNDAPVIDAGIADQAAIADQAFSFVVPTNSFEDPDDADTLTYAAQLAGGGALPGWLSFDAVTRTFSGTPTGAEVGTVSIDVIATDTTVQSVTDTFDIVIANDLMATNLSNTQGYTEELTYNLTDIVVATPQTNITAILTLSDVNAGALSTGTSGAVTSTWNAVTGTWTAIGAKADVNALLAATVFTPATDYDTNFTIATQVSDAHDILNGTITMNATGVNDAPTVDNELIDQFIAASGALSYTFAANTFDDPDTTDTLTYTAQLTGGSPLPAWLTFNSTTRTFTVAAGAGVIGNYTIEVTATDSGTLTVTDELVLAISPDALYGTPAADVIVGGASAELIIGLADNDNLRGDDDNDTIFGNEGNDDIFGQAGDDVLYGNDGNDDLYGENAGGAEAGSDTIYGGAGNDNIHADYQHSVANHRDDTVYGEDGNDVIYGWGGDDLLDGGADNDRIYDGDGNDTIVAGAGDDTLYVQDGQDSITLGDGNDQVHFYSPAFSTTVNPDTITDFTQGDDQLWVVGYTAIAAGAPSGTVLGYTFDGTYTNVSAADGFGFRLLGNYTLTVADFQFLSIIGTNGNDTLTGDNAINGILGLDGDDSIFGASGNDLIWGGDGNDTIDGGRGSSMMEGGAGNDVYPIYWNPVDIQYNASQNGLITDFVRGEDKIDVSALTITGVTSGSSVWENIGVSYNAGTDRTFVRISDHIGLHSGVNLYLSGNIALDASDFIFATPVQGTAGDEVLNGTAGDDQIIALEGNDTIYAGDGTNMIQAKDGNNYIDGSGTGANNIYTGTGNDTFIGGDGRDIIRTNGGTNYGFLGDGDDHIRKYTGYIFYEGGNDNLYNNNGGAGTTIYGGDGNDGLVAFQDDNIVYAERGNDNGRAAGDNSAYYGGEGNDFIYTFNNVNGLTHGGYGADTIRPYEGSGGAQQDNYYYYDPNESTATERDLIDSDFLNFYFDGGAEATADKLVIYGFTGAVEGAAVGTTLGYSYDGTHTILTSSASYSFEVRLRGDYTAADSDGDGEVFNANNFEFRAGTLGAMGDDTINGTGANDFIFGLEGEDFLMGGTGDDSVFGGHDNDLLYGQGGDDSISGGYGNDRLNGTTGADTLEGGSGADIFDFDGLAQSTDGNEDVINDFKHGGDADKIDLTGLGITGIGAGATELTIQYNGDQYTSISHNSSTFEILLLGLYESGTDIIASDFIF